MSGVGFRRRTKVRAWAVKRGYWPYPNGLWCGRGRWCSNRELEELRERWMFRMLRAKIAETGLGRSAEMVFSNFGGGAP